MALHTALGYPPTCQRPLHEQDTDADTVDATAVTRLLHVDIDNVLHTLSPRECGVLRMRYGLDDGQEKTLEEVGARFQARPPRQLYPRPSPTSLCQQWHIVS